MILYANAKVNMYLHITGKRKDGYHLLDTVFQEIDLHNTLTIEKDNRISISCSDSTVPCDETNTAYKAAAFFPGGKIHIEKGIPHQAGLGSASTDAAAVLKGLNLIYNLYNHSQLLQIAEKIGADVPFFIDGKCQHATGIGEVLSPHKPVLGYYLIIKPNFGISTKKSYEDFDNGKIYNQINHLTPQDYPFPELTMTGSGSAAFRIFDTLSEAETAAKKYEGLPFVKIVKPVI